jgi:SAM-dependent methyltransferase
VSEPPLSPNAWLRWELIRRELEAEPVSSVLELGMGQGAVGSRLSRYARYVGVEPDPSSRAVAERRLAAGATVLHDLDDLDPTERFDVVCAFEVLEHIEHDADVLATWSQRVEPAGRLLLSVPAHQHRFAAADELAGHFRRYSRADLERVLLEADLQPIRIDAVGFPLALVLERGRNILAKRELRKRAGQTIEDRTAGSGRLFQPPEWAGWVTRLATAPFRWLQLPFRNGSWASGWVVVARRAPG